MGHEVIEREFSGAAAELIGLESDLLEINSPFTYVTTEKVFAFEIDYKAFYNLMLEINPRGIEDFQHKCQLKVDQLTSFNA
jgi:hypothetical protein